MRIIDLGRTDFLAAYRIQRDFVNAVSENRSEDILLITEHFPAITIGGRGAKDNILRTQEFLDEKGICVFQTDRGGDVTYHGPGQIVAYPIFRLENEAKDIHRFLCFLERIGENFLAKYGMVSDDPRSGFRGLWVGGKKVGAIGIGVRKWVTYHGLAINVNLDLAPFSFIRPCGIKDPRITSLKILLEREVYVDDAKDKLKMSFREIPLLAETVSTN